MHYAPPYGGDIIMASVLCSFTSVIDSLPLLESVDNVAYLMRLA